MVCRGDIGAAFVVRDHSGQQLAYIYFEDEPGRRSAAKLLTKDESREVRPILRACRRVVICGFAAKPSALENRRLCLVAPNDALENDAR